MSEALPQGLGGSFTVETVDNFSSLEWRLNNLYRVIDDSGSDIPFYMNEMQLMFFKDMWYRNVTLKSRQHGATTGICILLLDAAVFYPNTTCGIIALTLDDVKKIFRRKIKHAYENLPAAVRQEVRATNDTQNELIFTNGSDISVDTGFRGGTYNYLLISEFGKIAITYPEKAVEIKVGSFNTVHKNNYIFVESTGHGKGGEFADLCKTAKDATISGRTLTRLDFKYHFYPWWMKAENCLSPDEAKQVVFTRKSLDYFARIEKRIRKTLTLEQKAWYVVQLTYNGDEMLREHPSIDTEPFEAVLKGAIFGEEMTLARAEGRIGKFKHERGIAVDTWWDIGRRDKTAIWFVQTIGNELRFIWYYEASFKQLPHFVKYCNDQRAEHGYFYRHHLGPHDMDVMEWGADKTRKATAKGLGYVFTVGRQYPQEDQIEAGRGMLANCCFDEENCSEGITHLEMIRREWSEHSQDYQQAILHNDHCFTPDTLVQTSTGIRRIDQLDGTDEVMTPCGFKPYLPARQTLANAQLVEVTFSDGSMVRCTPEHLFLTEFGWRSAESLRKGSLIQSCSTLPRSISKEPCSSVGRAAHISLAARKIANCIAQFGRGLLGRFQKAAISITETPFLSTTHSAILSACQQRNIFLFLGINTKGTSSQTSTSRTSLGSASRNGIVQMPQKYGESGQRIGQPFGSNSAAYPKFASTAAENLWALIGPGSERRSIVATNAGTLPISSASTLGRGSQPHNTSSPEHKSRAQSAAKNSARWSDPAPQIKNIAASNAAMLRIESVVRLNDRANTWCINVPDGHWFCLANGAVVHNSHGGSSFMNGAMMNGYLQKGKPRARQVQRVGFAT